MDGLYPHRELHRVPADLSKFWVIVVVSNPVRYKRRYDLTWPFIEMIEQAGVRYVLVEQAFGRRQHMITRPDVPHHLQVRSEEELWHKENMINMGVRYICSRFPGEVREIAWIDADCRPARPYRNWFEETWHQLQHYEFVQMWEYLQNLDVKYNPFCEINPSFMSNYLKHGCPYPKGILNNKGYNSAVKWGSPGLAWAANVDAFNKVGGLLDTAILGGGDWYFAHMLISDFELPDLAYYSREYRDVIMAKQETCNRWIKRDVGFVPGLVLHDFHGKTKNRGYNTRERILIDNKFNPHTDIKYDSYGMLQLETWDERQIKIRDQIRAYFRARDEDSIDI